MYDDEGGFCLEPSPPDPLSRSTQAHPPRERGRLTKKGEWVVAPSSPRRRGRGQGREGMGSTGSVLLF